ncbi:hypothetical protein [Chitinophaga rhizophila]|uniref:Uncharacterized protein n=1 Tax=Chitinophaga rhizophila TaxID=2866212 RepID=A0ABS7GM47_9BACT|nr:hypothetical protein [Chitinophaga rhizophila]MBW8687959.1 hypothetical protein [Chitinophaga rhizophila]
MKWIILGLISVLSSCSNLITRYDDVTVIDINNTRTDQHFTLTDAAAIKDLLQCVNRSWQEPLKFYPTYKLKVITADTTYWFAINKDGIKSASGTFKSIYDIERRLQSLELKIKGAH